MTLIRESACWAQSMAKNMCPVIYSQTHSATPPNRRQNKVVLVLTISDLIVILHEDDRVPRPASVPAKGGPIGSTAGVGTAVDRTREIKSMGNLLCEHTLAGSRHRTRPARSSWMSDHNRCCGYDVASSMGLNQPCGLNGSEETEQKRSAFCNRARRVLGNTSNISRAPSAAGAQTVGGTSEHR